MSRNVSITLLNTEYASPVVQPIEQDSPACVINHMPSLVQVDMAGSLRINRQTVEEILGREWNVQDIHLCLVSLSGEVEEEDDFFELSWK